MLFTSPLVTPSRVCSFKKGTYKNWNLFTEGKMQVLKKYYFGRLITSCRVYVYNQGFFPAFDIENRHALSLEFSFKRDLFAGSDFYTTSWSHLSLVNDYNLFWSYSQCRCPLSSFRTMKITKPHNHNISNYFFHCCLLRQVKAWVKRLKDPRQRMQRSF